MSYQQAKNLLVKYRDGNCSDDEKAIVEKWLFQYHNDEVDLTDDQLTEITNEVWHNLPQPARTISIWPRIAAAAAVLLFLAAGAYFVTGNKNSTQQISQVNFHDIDPGGNKAVLTLANGKTIVLTNAKNGVLASQHNAAITKTADGQVIYTEDHKPNDVTAEVSYNTLATPRGGKYELTLADGTKAILDAASSIKYPVAFTSNERRVEITGQVYFEVVHDAAKPFRVIAKGQTIEDLGTHFNINAYDDEPVMAVTLAEGSVKVGTGKYVTYLKPGQQTVSTPGDPAISVQQADMEEALAWTNGKIIFHDENLKSIMRRVCRWYNVDVIYQNDAGDMTFGGAVSRTKKISTVLNFFHKAGNIDFKIAGQTVTIIKQ